MAGTSPAAPGGEHTLEAGADTAPPTKFKFAGEEYADQAAAEQNVRTLKGQFKPVMGLARSLGGIDKIVPHLTQAAESARGWKAEHDRVKAELDAVRSGKSQPAAGDAQAESQESAEAGIDWALYAEVKKLATESGEPWKAEQWLIGEVQKAERAAAAKLIDERLKPYDEQREQAGVEAQTEGLVTMLQGYTLSDGSAAFPELGDDTASYEIGRMWAGLRLPRESMLTPQGLMAAIALYRMVKPGSGSQAKPTTRPTPPPQALAAPPPPTDAESAATMGDGRPLVASAPGNGHAPSAEASRILAGLRQANVGGRAHLGFDA